MDRQDTSPTRYRECTVVDVTCDMNDVPSQSCGEDEITDATDSTLASARHMHDPHAKSLRQSRREIIKQAFDTIATKLPSAHEKNYLGRSTGHRGSQHDALGSGKVDPFSCRRYFSQPQVTSATRR